MLVKTIFSGLPPSVDRLELSTVEELEAWVIETFLIGNINAIVKRSGSKITCYNIVTGRIFTEYECLREKASVKKL